MLLPNMNKKATIMKDLPKNAVWKGEHLNLGPAFRDPAIFLGPDGNHYIVVGTEGVNGEGGTILLYKKEGQLTKNNLCQGWEFKVKFLKKF